MIFECSLTEPKGLHNGTCPFTVQRNSEKLYGKGNPKKLNRKHSSILGLYRNVPASAYGTGIDSRVLLREKFVDAF